MESFKKILKEWGFVIFVFFTMGIFLMFFKISVVNGHSMEPTFQDGEYLLLKKETDIDRFDIIVIKKSKGPFYLGDPEVMERPVLIKRVIGLPGESLFISKEGIIYINDIPIEDHYRKEAMEFQEKGYELLETEIPEGYVYVLGDNRNHSADSRNYGLIPIKEILGEIILPKR